MTSAPDSTPHAVFARLVAGVSEQRWDGLAELYAEDAIVRHPFATDASALLRGRAQLHEHFLAAGAAGLDMTATSIAVHQAADPEVVTAEFTYQCRDQRTGERFDLPAVFVLRVRNGVIAASNDYLGPRQQPA